MPRPSRAVRGRPQLPCRVCGPPAARAHRDPLGRRGWGREGRRGRARAGGADRKEGLREGREKRCGRRGECEGRKEGRRRAAGLCPSRAPGAQGHLQHSLGSGCAEKPGLEDRGASAAKGPRLGASTARRWSRAGGVRAWGHLVVGRDAGGKAPAREDQGSSPRCPPLPLLKGLGYCGVRDPNGVGGGSGYLLRGEASLGPEEVVGRQGGDGAWAPGTALGLGASAGR